MTAFGRSPNLDRMADLNDKQKTFKTQLGQGPQVFREQVSSEAVEEGNKRLREIGRLLNPIPKHLTYRGSAAVHIFYNETLGQLYLASQTQPLLGCDEVFAQAALRDLTGSTMEQYGHKRPKLRSGF